MKSIRAFAAAVVATAGLGGCSASGPAGASAAADRDAPAPLLGESGCFRAESVQDFRVLDRATLIVYAPNDASAYEVRVSPSSQLRWANALVFARARGDVCGRAGDRLLVGPPAAAERLAILDVRKLAPADLAELRDRTGPASPASPPAAP